MDVVEVVERQMCRTQLGWEKLYEEKRAYWSHDNNFSRPHVELTTLGMHARDFFNSKLVMADPCALREIVVGIVDRYIAQGGVTSFVERVVGPEKALAQALCDEINIRTRDEDRGPKGPCQWGSLTKVGEGSSKKFVFDDPEHAVEEGEIVLLSDDVFTTGGTLKLAMNAVRERKGRLLGFVCIIVNRSSDDKVEKKEIVSLIKKPMVVYHPDACPLCDERSVAVRAQGNWDLLTAEY